MLITEDKFLKLEFESPEDSMNLTAGFTSIHENADKSGEIVLDHAEIMNFSGFIGREINQRLETKKGTAGTVPEWITRGLAFSHLSATVYMLNHHT